MLNRFALRLGFVFVCLLHCFCSTSPVNIPEYKTDYCSHIHRNDSVSLTKELSDVQYMMDRKTGVYVLEDGDGAMVARAWLCEYAEKSIDIQYFIFSTDNVGLIACDYLVRAADRGVKVRIIVDDIMVDASAHDILTLDSHKNIFIKIYNPGANLGKNLFQKTKMALTNFRGINQRMHNKTFIVDNKVSITGGRNIADEYFDYDHEYNFRDRDVLLVGRISKTINHSFDEFWNSSLCVPVVDVVKDTDVDLLNPNRFDVLHNYACNPENFWPQVRDKIKNVPLTFSLLNESGKLVWTDSIKFVSDSPGKNDGKSGLEGGGRCTDALVSLVENAKTSIDIQSPYLITTESSRILLKKAVERGVKIRILTNSLASTDNIEAFSGYQRDREKLLNTGVKVFEFRPDAQERYTIMTGALQYNLSHKPIFGLHAKTMVIDGNITVIGTFNFDPRSANLNTECVSIIYSNSVAKNVLQGMNVEFEPANSWETTIESNPDKIAGLKKNVKSYSRKIIPKNIL